MAVFGFEPRRPRHLSPFVSNKNSQCGGVRARLCNTLRRRRSLARLNHVSQCVVPDLRRSAAVGGHRVAVDRQRDVLVGVTEASADLRDGDSVAQ